MMINKMSHLGAHVSYCRIVRVVLRCAQIAAVKNPYEQSWYPHSEEMERRGDIRAEEEEVSVFKVKEREEGRRRGEEEKEEGITESAGISWLLSSFYPGTKLLFRRRLLEFGKPVE